MKKINTLSLWALKEKYYVAFMRFVNSAIAESEIIKQWFAFQVSRFIAAYNHLDEVFLKYDIDECTKAVQEAGTERDRAFREMRDVIRMEMTYPKSEPKKLAAEALMRIIELYGGAQILKLGITAKSAAYSNMVEDFETKFPTDVEIVGIAQELQALKAAQQLFDEKYMARAVCESEVVKGAMVEARKQMNEYYHLLVDAINVKVYEDEEGELDPFINLMNVEVGRYRIYTGQGQVGNSSGSSTDSEEEGNRTKTATFNFINGNSLKLRLAVGALIEVPVNTLGYCWKPEVPEFMPAKNCTFREVPIEEEEATATFHFADHREEEITQPVGSALVAPQNTEGYVWDPEVPATMPAEATSYYEMPVQNNTEEEEEEPPILS